MNLIMNSHRLSLLLFASFAATVNLPAQDPPTAAAGDKVLEASPAPQSEMQKWLATTDAQWQAAFKREVTDIREAELNKVKLQYLAALEDGVKKTSAASDLSAAVGLRNEQKRFGDTQLFPEKDEESDTPAVKSLRAAVRVQLARVARESALRAKTLHEKYDQALAQAQGQLTQRQRLDDALLVKTKRDEVAAVWLPASVLTVIKEEAAAQAEKAAAKAASKTKPAPIAPMVAGMDPKKVEDIKKMLVGSWRLTWPQNGWTAKRVFNADGTVTAVDPGKADVTGHWEISKDKVTATLSNGVNEDMLLPLHVSGTKVIGNKGRELKAAKENR